MRVKKKKTADFVLVVLFLFSFGCFLYLIKGTVNPTDDLQPQVSGISSNEQFDHSLSRLNSISKLLSYCDSVKQSDVKGRNFPSILSETIRKKFYHGFSYYTVENNPLGVLFGSVVGNGATAIVVPDDIVKYPNAACSQQSIVGMEIFKLKGYDVRKITMF